MTGRRRLALAAAPFLALLLLASARELAQSRTVQIFGTLIAEVPVVDSSVALTFDDGPSDVIVDSLVAMLRSRGVQATFFLIGTELARSPEAGSKLHAAGHELANHSWSHPHLVLKSPARVRLEVERTDSLLRAAGERGRIRFRPPYGYKLVGLPWYLARTGRTTVMWSIEPESYPEVASAPEAIVRHVLERVRPGAIIVLHPWYDSRATTRAAIGPLVDSLQARGYRVGTIGSLLARGGPAGR